MGFRGQRFLHVARIMGMEFCSLLFVSSSVVFVHTREYRSLSCLDRKCRGLILALSLHPKTDIRTADPPKRQGPAQVPAAWRRDGNGH